MRSIARLNDAEIGSEEWSKAKFLELQESFKRRFGYRGYDVPYEHST